MPKLLPQLREQLDAAIRDGAEPFSLGSRMLYVRAPGRRRAVGLFDRRGELNAAGTYYFQQRAREPPDRAFRGDPTIVGRREVIALGDGSQVTLRTFRAGQWQPTKQGREYYRDRRVTYIVYFPVTNVYTKDDGRQYFEDDLLPSTATDLGHIQVPASLSDAERDAEVRRRAEEFVAGLHPEDGHIVLDKDYYVESVLKPDWLRGLQVARESVAVAEGHLAVEATQRRPLRAGRPWRILGDFADCALEDTQGDCVAHQLKTLATRDGRPVFGEEVYEAFQRAYEELYAGKDDPYEGEDWREHGVTSEMCVQVCRDARVAVHVWWRGRCIATSPGEGAEVAYEIYGDHAYFLPKGVTFPGNCSVVHPTVVAKDFRRHPEEDASQWLDYAGDLQPGATYRVPEDRMAGLREELHRARVLPRVRLAGPTQIAALTVPLPKGTAVVRAVPEDWQRCAAFCELVARDLGRPFPYTGARAMVVSQRALEELFRAGARPHHNCRQQLSERQDGRCAQCGDDLDDRAQVDHGIPRATGGPDDLSNFQLLCPPCHRAKTGLQTCGIADDFPLRSRLNSETHELFHASRKPPQLVARFRAAANCEIDVRRCRYNGLVQLEGDIPIFAPTDDIRPRTEGLGDYCYVERCRIKSPLLALPFFGPGWYGRRTCEWLLERRVVAWDDITHVLSASARIPAKVLAEKMARLERWWEEVGDAKAAINAMLGLWGRPETWRYRLETASEDQDVLFRGTRHQRATPGTDGVFQDHVLPVRVLTYGSLRPVHQLCLEAERLRVAQAVCLVRDFCKIERIAALNVDSVQLHAGGPKNLAKLRAAVERQAYPDGTPIYRFQTAFRSMNRGAPLEFVDAPAWRLEGAWRSMTGPESLRHVADGGTFLCEAPPGFGKSVLLKQLEAQLVEAGRRVRVVAPTHVAARQLGGSTAHSFVHRYVLHGNWRGDHLLVDEFSMISVELAACLEQLRLGGVRIVCFGDRKQLPPVLPSWRGQAVSPEALGDSRLLGLWAGWARCVLTEYRRGQDLGFCRWFCEAREHGSPLEAVRRFPAKPGPADWNLTLSNYRRRRINEQRQRELAAGREAVLVDFGDEGAHRIFAGTKLIATANHKRLTNGTFLTVADIGETATVVDEDGHRVVLSLAALGSQTRLRHAITINAAQGRTLPGRVRVHDCGSSHFTTTHLYVAASRATSGDLFEAVL